MRYIINRFIVVFLFTLFFFHQESRAGETYQDPKWNQYLICIGWHHMMAEQLILKSKDELSRQIALEVARIGALDACKPYLPKVN